MVLDEEQSNYQLFRDCLSTPLIEKSVTEVPKKKKTRKYGRKTAIKPVSAPAADEANDAEELADFIDVSVSGTLWSIYLPNSILQQKSLKHCRPNYGA